ncbi:MAG: L-glyceraldehyde 3-phosphate reductase [Phycisphaerae bacterium]|nr:L-glyceraldehyde 3-phosphate reductase [Phycisphaerae bacterium]
MNYRRLGSAGIRLSEIGLGSWLTFGSGVDDTVARACIRRAFELGVNFFDTADVYARGASETTCGRELKEFRRSELVIATKCYFPMSDAPNDRGLSRKHVVESVHASLTRLQTEYIDLYQCHRFDPDVEMFELVRAMDDLIRQGKILYWGVSEWPAEAIRQACAVAARLGACPPCSNQPEYSIAARRVETNGVRQACQEAGLGLVVWSPLKQGLLTGKYAAGKPRDSRASHDKMNAFLKELDARIVERTEQLRPLAQRHGMTLAQFAIAWLLRRPALTSVIIGASRVAQVEENVAAAGFSITAEDEARVDQLFPADQFA